MLSVLRITCEKLVSNLGDSYGRLSTEITQSLITGIQPANKPSFVHLLYRYLPHHSPQGIVCRSPHIKLPFSTVYTPPITTTTNLKREES